MIKKKVFIKKCNENIEERKDMYLKTEGWKWDIKEIKKEGKENVYNREFWSTMWNLGVPLSTFCLISSWNHDLPFIMEDFLLQHTEIVFLFFKC